MRYPRRDDTSQRRRIRLALTTHADGVRCGPCEYWSTIGEHHAWFECEIFGALDGDDGEPLRCDDCLSADEGDDDE